jgi:ABC-type polar amino acid transport system ATPase subunit
MDEIAERTIAGSRGHLAELLDLPKDFLGHATHSVQFVGPAGCGKRSILRELAFNERHNPESIVVRLFKEDFRAQGNLGRAVLESCLWQNLFKKPTII